MWNQAQQALNESMGRLLSQFASLLPGIMALIVALLVSALVAWMLAVLVRRSLTGVHFDERLAGWGLPSLSEWSPSKSPTLLVTRVVSWLVILIGFLIGIASFDATLTSQLVHSLFAYLPNVLGALLVLLVGSIIARFLARSVLIGAVNMNLQYARLLSVGVKWLVIVLAVAMALEHLKIGAGTVQLAFGILFGGIVFALALAVGLGSKELITRSLEREASKASTETVEEPFRHV
jgi:Mechanosensitive ion channel, conserved TM helix